MTNRGQITKHKLTGGMLLFTASFLLYSLVSPGNLPGDSEVRWSVARQMVRGRGICLEDNYYTLNYAVGIDGRRYSYYGIGQSICMLPFAGIGLALEKVFLIDPNTSDLAAQFLACTVLFPIIGAAVVWLFYHLVLLVGYSQSVAIFSSVVLAFATMNFHYSVSTQEQTQVGLLLVVAILLMVKNLQRPSFLYAWLLCAVLGLCLLFRLASLVMVLPIYLVAAGAEVFSGRTTAKPKVASRWLAAGLLGTGGFVAIIAWYNYVRFGSVFESGYTLAKATALGGHTMFESALLPALAAMLFSPGKSIFLYNPVLLLVPFCYYRFYRKHKFVTLAVSAAVIANFILYGLYTFWAGDYAWSIRYQVPVLAFLVLPLAFLFSRTMKTAVKILTILFISVSCVIQLASVTYKHDLEFNQNPNHCSIPDDYIWDWSQSHLLWRFDNIWGHLTNNRDFNSVEVIDEEPLIMKRNFSEESVRKAYCVNFFPFKARSMLPSTKLFYSLLCVWLVLLAGFCAAVFKLVRFYIKQKT